MTLGPTPEQAVEIKKVEPECTDHSTSDCTALPCPVCVQRNINLFLCCFFIAV